jgi:hypothetical protein
VTARMLRKGCLHVPKYHQPMTLDCLQIGVAAMKNHMHVCSKHGILELELGEIRVKDFPDCWEKLGGDFRERHVA